MNSATQIPFQITQGNLRAVDDALGRVRVELCFVDRSALLNAALRDVDLLEKAREVAAAKMAKKNGKKRNAK